MRTAKQVLAQVLADDAWLDPKLQTEAEEIVYKGDLATQKLVREAYILGMNVARVADYYSMCNPLADFFDEHKEELGSPRITVR
jgi:hypothetical protein